MAKFRKGDEIWWLRKCDITPAAPVFLGSIKHGTVQKVESILCWGTSGKHIDLYDVQGDDGCQDALYENDDFVAGSRETAFAKWLDAVGDRAIIQYVIDLEDRIRTLENKVKVLDRYNG